MNRALLDRELLDCELWNSTNPIEPKGEPSSSTDRSQRYRFKLYGLAFDKKMEN